MTVSKKNIIYTKSKKIKSLLNKLKKEEERYTSSIK